MSATIKSIALEVKNLSKSFRLPSEKAGSAKQAIVNFVKGIRGYTQQQVLKDISFAVHKGDFFGIVGRNGSGKSTLLKLISGIYTTEHGSIAVNGSLVSFIELGVGFNGELTGRENVYLNGALMGFSRAEIDNMYDEIVNFAELHDFMEQKLKNYSSGMQVRLAFSCAIQANSDILVLDEVLAVGDEAFQRKCNDYFSKMGKDKGKTIILVTHSMAAVRQFCNKAMMIHDGEVVICGSPEDVANEYSLINLQTPFINDKGEPEKSIITDYKIDLISKSQISQSEKVKIQISYKTTKDIETYAVVNLHDMDRNVPIMAGNSSTRMCKKGQAVTHTITFDLAAINNTNLIVNSSIRGADDKMLAFYPQINAPKFVLRRNDYRDPKKPAIFAVLYDRGNWQT